MISSRHLLLLSRHNSPWKVESSWSQAFSCDPTITQPTTITPIPSKAILYSKTTPSTLLFFAGTSCTCSMWLRKILLSVHESS